ncbi:MULTISPECIES: OsmC family protein [Paenibacillus]|uniref:OsmC family protein n=1 Tax=Paenibacillus residui TaxID=629724 RepID=A0ABW3D6F0_9BACL|nr:MULTISPECIES: OsmC family protein [Paenibacillaceae]
MKIRTEWQGKRKFKSLSSRNHEVMMDAVPDVGGENAGSSPMELVLMGLTGCMGIDVTMILEKMRLAPDRLEIEAAGIRAEEPPRRFVEIHLTFHVDGDIKPDKIWRAIRLSEQKYCSVAHSLNSKVASRLLLNGKEEPPAGQS